MPEIHDTEAVQAILFERGLPGFQHLTKFAIEQSDPNVPLAVLQSLEEENVWFLIGDPFSFYQDYEFELSEEVENELKVEETGELTVWGIITYKGSILESTMNLQAPVVINHVKGIGKQVILNDSRFSIRHPIVHNPAIGVNSNAGA